MSKQSDIFMKMEFKRKNYKREITKALKSGSEKIINQEINKVNKIMRDRIKKLEEKGLEKFSPAYQALGRALGTAGGKPVILRPAAMPSLEDKIQYLQGMRSVIDQKSMTLGGVRDSLLKGRQSQPILQQIYEKHGEEYAAGAYGKYWELMNKLDLHGSSDDLVKEHENEIIEILENFHDKESIIEFNQKVESLADKIYQKENNLFNSITHNFLGN